MVDKCTIDKSLRQSAVCDKIAVEEPIVAIHQPNYVPWLGYFFKIAHSAKFVFLDTVAYSHGGFANRNAIKTPNGSAWLTIPVSKSGRSGQLIADVQPNHDQRWEVRHLATLTSNYGRAPFFKEIFAMLEPHYRAVAGNRVTLADFNISVICAITKYLGVRTQFIRSSQLAVSGQKTDLLIDICRSLGAGAYLAGTGGKAYQEDSKFEDAGIVPLYSAFSQRGYPQLFGTFVGNLSIVDVLMNCGHVGTRHLLDIEHSGNYAHGSTASG